MKKKAKKIISTAAALTVAAASFVPMSRSLSENIDAHAALALGTYEAEDLDIGGQEVWQSVYENKIGGEYSGSGFIYLTSTEFSLEVEVDEDGMYSISSKCAQILSQEGRMQTVSINGVDYTYNLPYMDTWTDVDLGVFRLNAGVNKIVFKPQLGYAEYDTITVEQADLPELYGDPVSCDPNATDETKALMKYLSSVYGEHTIAGQQEIYGGGHAVEVSDIRYDPATDTVTDSEGNQYTFDESSKDVGDDGNTFVWTVYGPDGKEYNYNTQNRNYTFQYYDQEFDFIKDLSGDYPAIRGYDFMNYNPLYGWDDGTTKRVIQWVKDKGGIATASWHINIPVDFENYTVGETLDWTACTYKNNESFKVANIMIDGTKEKEYFDLAIEDLAEQFQILQDANVPIIFRPLHEAEGNGGTDGKGAWFWWSQEGTETYKELWKYLYNALTNDYGLHNIVWEQNLYAYSAESAEWYAGDDYVDIVGFDKYNTVYNRHDGKTSGPNEDAESRIFYSLVDYVKNNKMVSMPENSTVPSLGNMLTEKAHWLYFCVWYDGGGSDNFLTDATAYNDPDTLKEMYQSDYCIMLSELPDDLYVYDGESGETPTKPPTTEPPSEESSTEPTATPTTEPATSAATGETGEDEPMLGDVDLNRIIDVADVVEILNYVVTFDGTNGVPALSEEAVNNADVYQRGDGITSGDAAAVQKFIAKIIDSLPETTME